jgi:hypothetical protein
MIVEDMRTNGQSWKPSAAAERAVLEQRVRLRRLLRAGMGQVQAAVMGAQAPIRSTVAAVQAEFARHLAETDALMLPDREAEPPFGRVTTGRLQGEFAAELVTLETLSAWPEDDDELELSLRFQALVPVLLDAIVRGERYLLEAVRDDLAVGDPFGC